jgi:hypothetical protein
MQRRGLDGSGREHLIGAAGASAATAVGRTAAMADERTEDLSDLDADAVGERIRSLMNDGWQPGSLTLTREKDPSDEKGPVLRDDPEI